MGCGPVALFAAQAAKELREIKQPEASAEDEQLEQRTAVLEKYCDEIDKLTAATLEEWGFHRHKRGEWRKRRA